MWILRGRVKEHLRCFPLGGQLEHFVDLKLQLYFFRPTSATIPLSVKGIDVHEA